MRFTSLGVILSLPRCFPVSSPVPLYQSHITLHYISLERTSEQLHKSIVMPWQKWNRIRTGSSRYTLYRQRQDQAKYLAEQILPHLCRTNLTKTARKEATSTVVQPFWNVRMTSDDMTGSSSIALWSRRLVESLLTSNATIFFSAEFTVVLRHVDHMNNHVMNKVSFLTSEIVKLQCDFQDFCNGCAQAISQAPRNTAVRDFEVRHMYYFFISFIFANYPKRGGMSKFVVE